MRDFISRNAAAARRTSRRAARTEVRRLAALAEGVGGIGEAHDRADLVAQEQDGDGEQNQRGRHHPDQEHPGVGVVDVGAAGEDPHDRVGELDADLDDRGAADGVDPERQLDLLADLLRQRLIELREERLRSGRRQLRLREEIDHQAEPVLGDAAQLRAVGALRIGVVDIDEGGDLLRHRRRQVTRHQAPLPVHEHESDHRLQHHHRHDDDQQRSGIEPLRHHRLDPAGDAVPEARNAAGDRTGGVGRCSGGGDQMAGGAARPAGAVVEAGRGAAHGVATSR